MTVAHKAFWGDVSGLRVGVVGVCFCDVDEQNAFQLWKCHSHMVLLCLSVESSLHDCCLHGQDRPFEKIPLLFPRSPRLTLSRRNV